MSAVAPPGMSPHELTAAGRRRGHGSIALTAVAVGSGLIAMVGAWELHTCAGIGCPTRDQIVECDVPRPTVMDANGSVLWREERPKAIPPDSIPNNLRNAFIAKEDKRYAVHAGTDWRAAVGAAWANATNGAIVRGASTITMQTARLLFIPDYGTNNRGDFRRKFAEVILARRMESVATKNQILACYLSLVPVTPTIIGVREGAWRLFGKRYDELLLAEAATLAAMVSSPALLDPRELSKRPRTKAKRNLVLRLMREQTLIEENTLNAASARPLLVTRNPALVRPTRGCAIDRTLAFADSVVGLSRIARIKTTLDSSLLAQSHRSTSEATRLTVARGNGRRRAPDAVLVMVGVRTGAITALDCGRNYTQGGFNAVFHAKRQLGSTFKIAVFGSFLEAGGSERHLVPDTLMRIVLPGGRTWTPRNADGQYMGMIPLLLAGAESRNPPSVSLLLDLGYEAVRDFGDRIGLSAKFENTPAAALGTGTTAPINVAVMMATIANGGHRVEPYLVTEIFGHKGQTLWKRTEVKPTRAIDAATATDLRTLLRGVISHGTASAVASVVHPGVFAKTATTTGSRDAWFTAADTGQAAVMWVGHRYPRPMNGVSGALLAVAVAPLFVGPVSVHDGPRLPPQASARSHSAPRNAIHDVAVIR